VTRAKLILTALMGFTLGIIAVPSTGSAMSSYYSTNCAGCHGSTVATCNGCHMHGGQNVSGSISKTSFAPGEAMSITVNAGTRTGWWRAAILDQSNAVVTTATVSSGLTTTVSVPAPQAGGTYSWKVAWYGNQRDATPPSGASWRPDANNPNHGFQMASLTPFTVVVAPAPAPVATLSASSLAFGNVTVGQSASRTTSVGNTGNATLGVTAVAPCSNTAPPYGISPNAAFTVAAGASRTLTVTFAPTSTGTFNGCFDLSTNDPNHATLRVTVSGAGTAVAAPSATLSPASLAFGDVTVGQAVTKTATVGNTGAASLSVSGVTPCDSGNSAALSVTPTAAFSVGAGGTQVLTVRFAPTATGAAAGCWNVATNDPGHLTLQLRASGNGVAVPPPTAPSATLSPTSLAFGDVTVGQSATKTATVGNTGSAALAVSGVTACDATNAASLSVTPTAAFGVAAGGSQVLTVRFAPAAAGAATGCWNIATNDPGHATLQLRASGNGVAAPPPPTQSCGTCHAIPPATGRHSYHRSEGVGCGRCHGTGYSATTVNSATHNNGTVNVAASAGWNSTSRSCSNSCHGTESWAGTTTPPPSGSCGSCHAIPPNSGRHLDHQSDGVRCSQCHGDGYSTTTVNSRIHNNGRVNLRSSSGWNTSTRSCSNSCHGSESWFGSGGDDGEHDDEERRDDDFVLGGDEEPKASGGCSSAGGSMTFLALAGLGILATLRRRRA
jgi:uncharacterized protein (TIGR03382 family)